MKSFDTLIKNYYRANNNEKEQIKKEVIEKIAKVKEKQSKFSEKNLENIEKLSEKYFKNHSIEKPKNKYPINYFLTKNKKIKESIISKEQSRENLLELKENIQSKKFNENLMNKLKKDSNLSNNKDLLIILRGYSKKKTFEFEENKKEISEEDKTLILFRNIIKNSHQEAYDLSTLDITPIELFKEFGYIKETNLNLKNPKINEFYSNIVITSSFKIFLEQIEKYLENSIEMFQKIVSLLYIMYNGYYKIKEFDSKNFINLILIQNNIDLFCMLINYHILFITEKENNKNILFNVFVFLKNFSSGILNQIMSNFISDLTMKMSEIETFVELSSEQNFKNCQNMLKDSQELIFKFFNSLQDFITERAFIFNLNYVLSLYFDLINRKIILVKDFSINDIKNILNIGKEIVPQLKKNLEIIASDNLDFSIRLISILEKNNKYKKFEEILFVINANLVDIRNFVINNNFKIHIDQNELIELIISCFTESENRNNLINFIKEGFQEKNN